MNCAVWHYVAHEDEFPHRGDFKLFQLGGQSVIVVRDEEDQIRVLLNICRHRRVPVCRRRQGNTRTFTCVDHGWVYNTKGCLIGLQGPAASIRRFSAREGLLPVPRVEVLRGCIYASLEAVGESLHEYLNKERGERREP